MGPTGDNMGLLLLGRSENMFSRNDLTHDGDVDNIRPIPLDSPLVVRPICTFICINRVFNIVL